MQLPIAVVPIRIGPTAKRRLAHVVDGETRASLVIEWFEHVVTVLRGVGLRVIALTPSELDDAFGAEVWRDREHTLNAALDDAISRLGVPVAVVHADLPCVSQADVLDLVGTSGDVVIARARDGGTNALLLRRSLAVSFGPGSALVHAHSARAAGLQAVVVDRPGLALDVDDEASLIASSAFPRPVP